MFDFDISDELQKKLKKLTKKDKILVLNFKKKLSEIISQNKKTINTYKNLKSPLQDLKRIHLTGNFVLLFTVNIKENKVIFIDIKHRDFVYNNSKY